MCEPHHSIVQYDPNDDDNPQGGSYILTKLGDWSKRVGKWLHLSKFGNGHSEAVGHVTGNMMLAYEEQFIKYEAKWWDRSFKQDGCKILLPGQMDCAEDYAKQTSIGNIQQLRNFLDVSIFKSPRPYLYYCYFYQYFLNQKGRDSFDKKFKYAFNHSFTERSSRKLNTVNMSKFVLGFTRKRNLIVPEWSDG